MKKRNRLYVVEHKMNFTNGRGEYYSKWIPENISFTKIREAKDAMAGLKRDFPGYDFDFRVVCYESTRGENQ